MFVTVAYQQTFEITFNVDLNCVSCFHFFLHLLSLFSRMYPASFLVLSGRPRIKKTTWRAARRIMRGGSRQRCCQGRRDLNSLNCLRRRNRPTRTQVRLRAIVRVTSLRTVSK